MDDERTDDDEDWEDELEEIDEEGAAERRARVERFDWSFARDEDVAYGNVPGREDEWLVLPRAMMEEIGDTRGVVDSATTWGEVRRGVPTWRLDEIATMMEERGYFDDGGTYEGLTFADVPDDSTFSRPGYGDDQFPEWPDTTMLKWLGWSIVDEYGGEGSSMASHWYSIYDIDGLLDGLRSVGATCEEDHPLAFAAYDGR